MWLKIESSIGGNIDEIEN